MKIKLLFVGVLMMVLLTACSGSGAEVTTKKPETTETGTNVEKTVKNEVDLGDTTLVYKVSLGVLPDLGYEGKGMRITNVHEDKPGFEGGLQNGDIVLRINGEEVEDLVSYTKILGKYKKGDTVSLTYKRGGELAKTEVRF